MDCNCSHCVDQVQRDKIELIPADIMLRGISSSRYGCPWSIYSCVQVGVQVDSFSYRSLWKLNCFANKLKKYILYIKDMSLL